MIEAVLWDNDGVLVDTEALFFEVTKTYFNGLGLALTEGLWATRYLGQGTSSRNLALALGGNPEEVDGMIRERNQEFLRVISRPPPIRPQVRETLSTLSGRVRMAMVTGCHRDSLNLMHQSTGLLHYFEKIVTGDQCVQAKPHPELYLAGIMAMGVKPERCLAIEDSPRGAASARAAGVPCLVVPTDLTRDLAFPGALAIERDVSAVLRYVRDGQALQS